MALQFDMFSESGDEVAAKRGRVVPIKRPPPAAMTETDMVQHLTNTGRYRILERLEPRRIAEIVRPEFPFKGVLLDTETTGLDHRQNEIIEIGAIAFTYNDDGAIGDVTGVYGGW